MTEYKGLSEIELYVNGANVSAGVYPSETLLYTLRDRLGLTGAKAGCENGDCGTCTVLVDGLPMKSCLMLAVEAVGKSITTIEGLKDAPIQQAFMDKKAFQCGYCTSGFIMVCHSLLTTKPDADGQTIAEWLQSNICRCTCYEEIADAVKSVLKGNK